MSALLPKADIRDPAREYAYGPATGLPDTKVGTFTQALYDEAKRGGWTVISMKNDWKRISIALHEEFLYVLHRTQSG